MRSIALLLCAAAALGSVGCAGSTVRVYEDPSAAPRVESVPADALTSSGVMCLFAWSGSSFYGGTKIIRRGGYRLMTKDAYDPKACDALIHVRQSGVSAYGTSFVDVFAPHGGDKVLQVQAEGGWGPVMGFEAAGRWIKSQLAPGAALRKRLDAGRAAKPLLTPEQLEAIAGPSALTWETLITWESDSAELAKMRQAKAASEARSSLVETAAKPAAAEPAAAREDEEKAVASDLDALPNPAAKNPHAHAIVIGVERYREKLPRADFASGDAKLAAEYFKRVLGVPDANLALLVDDHASKSDFEKYFTRWLPNRVEADDEVYVYFSGHGAPNPKSGDAYLVPFDGDPTYIAETGYPIKKLYEQLAKLPAKRVYIAMDSCFSGAGGRSVIAKGARPLVSVKTEAVSGKLTVLSASAGDQISSSYDEKGHGLFTYFLLKGLKEKGGDFKAAFDYLKPEVTKIARRDLNADQDPQWSEGR